MIKAILVLILILGIIFFPAHALVIGIGLFAFALLVGFTGLLIAQIIDFFNLFSPKQRSK